ncbi:ICP1 protein [Dolichospermum phage Dfl-JY45]
MATATRDIKINIRTHATAKSIIDRGAEVLNTSVSSFMIEASVQRAEAVLADRTRFRLSDEKMKAFVDALDAPLPNPAALKALLNHKAPWERG